MWGLGIVEGTKKAVVHFTRRELMLLTTIYRALTQQHLLNAYRVPYIFLFWGN